MPNFEQSAASAFDRARPYRSSARQVLCAIRATEDIFAIGVDQRALVIAQRRLRQFTRFDPESKMPGQAPVRLSPLSKVALL